MQVLRKYKKLGWFDFLEYVEKELAEKPKKEVYIEVADELRMRKIESVSEGGTYKLKKPASELFLTFEKRMSEDSGFATVEDLEEMKSLIDFIL